MVFGGGSNSFWIDVPDAVAQAISTRLKLQLGEWFLDTSDGTPWSTQILGTGTAATYDPAIRARILGTPGASVMLSYDSSKVGRALNVQAQVATTYSITTASGTTTVAPVNVTL